MTNAGIKDEIPAGQKFVENSVRVYNVNANGKDSELIDSSRYDVIAPANNDAVGEPKVLEVKLYNTADKNSVRVYYKTWTDVNYEGNGFENTDKISLKNKVTLYRDYYAEQSAYATETVDNNKVLYKTADTSKAKKERVIDYTVNINREGLNLIKDADVDKVVLKDSFSKGLQLDTTSVKLFRAEVNGNNGKFTKLSEVKPITLNYYGNPENGDDPYFELELPVNGNSITGTYDDRFVLEYTLLIIDGNIKKISNKIGLTGFALKETDGTHSFEISGKVDGGGDFQWAGRGSVSIFKIDSGSKEALEGAVFELWLGEKDNGGTFIVSGSTDQNGELKFDAIKYGTYNLYEVTAPEGYKAGEKVTVEITGSEKNISYTAENKRETGNVIFDKIDNWGNPVEGAEFEIIGNVEDNGFSYTDTAESKDGKVEFKDVPFGKYTIKETAAPDG